MQGRPTEAREQVTVDAVSPGLLEAVGAHLLRGRQLNDADYLESPSAVVINRTFAERFFPGKDPAGKYLKFGTAEAQGPWIRVVGVVADLRRQGLEKRPVREAFGPVIGSNMDVVVRTSAPPRSLVSAIRSVVHELDPNAPVYVVTTLDERLGEYAADRRATTVLAFVAIGGCLVPALAAGRTDPAALLKG